MTEARAALARGEQRRTDLNRERGEAEQARLTAEQAERNLLPCIRDVANTVHRLAGDVGRADSDARTARRAYNEAVQTLPDGR